MRYVQVYCKRISQMVWAISLLALVQGCGGPEQESSMLQRANSGGVGGAGDKGGKCKVVSGPNKGRTGTYDGEGWCTGDWGGTECQDSSGRDNGKCKDAKKLVIATPIGVGVGGVLKRN